MDQNIKVKFTRKTYDKLCQMLFEKISSFGKIISDNQMILTVPVAGDDGKQTVSTLDALKEMSTYSYAMARLTTILHALEFSNQEFKETGSVRSDMIFEIDMQTVVMLREFLNEHIMEQTQLINDYSFKLNTFVSLGKSVDNVTSLKALDILRDAGTKIYEYSDILGNFEHALKKYTKQMTAMQTTVLN